MNESHYDKLNAKQRRFCEEYVKDNNGAKAAIRAGYGERSARSKASHQANSSIFRVLNTVIL